MLVQAKHGINYDGTWYQAGDRFEVSRTDMDALKSMVYVIEAPINRDAGGDDRPSPRKKKAED